MTIKAWPDIQRGTGEVVENLKMRKRKGEMRKMFGVTVLAN